MYFGIDAPPFRYDLNSLKQTGNTMILTPCPYDPITFRYDLNSLKQTGDGLSYIANDASQENKYKYFINVCHSLTSTREYDKYKCDTEAGGCQVTLPADENAPNAAANAQTVSLGKPSSPTIVTDDAGKTSLQLRYVEPISPISQHNFISFNNISNMLRYLYRENRETTV